MSPWMAACPATWRPLTGQASLASLPVRSCAVRSCSACAAFSGAGHAVDLVMCFGPHNSHPPTPVDTAYRLGLRRLPALQALLWPPWIRGDAAHCCCTESAASCCPCCCLAPRRQVPRHMSLRVERLGAHEAAKQPGPCFLCCAGWHGGLLRRQCLLGSPARREGSPASERASRRCLLCPPRALRLNLARVLQGIFYSPTHPPHIRPHHILRAASHSLAACPCRQSCWRGPTWAPSCSTSAVTSCPLGPSPGCCAARSSR